MEDDFHLRIAVFPLEFFFSPPVPMPAVVRDIATAMVVVVVIDFVRRTKEASHLALRHAFAELGGLGPGGRIIGSGAANQHNANGCGSEHSECIHAVDI